MTTPKRRALQALADATSRPLLAAAPLMAIVEAVQVLDAAGLLAVGAANVPAVPSAAVAELSLHRRVWRVIDDETLDDSAHVVQNIVEVLDSHKPVGAAAALYELVDDAEKAKAVLDDEGFQGRTLEAQVRELLVAWCDERDEARRLRAGLNIPVSEETRARIMASIGSNPGSKHAIMYAARVAPWVSSVEWKDGRDGPVLVIGTCDGMGLDDLRRSELRAALDTQRAAGVPIVAEIDGWPFTHPEVPLPCPDCGADDADSHLSGCQAAEELADAMLAACPDCGVVDESHLGGCDDVAPTAQPTDIEADRVPCPKCGEPLTPTGMCLNFPACPDATIPF